MQSEVPDTLARALHSPITLTFQDASEAKNWQFRALNYIRRHAPHLAQLMITRDENELKIRVPRFTVSE